jgi:hypothetical protein
MNRNGKSHVETYLQITPGNLCLGTFTATASYIERVQAEPQAAVMLHRPGMAEGEQGMLMAVCGEASDPASCREAVLYAASPLLFEACMELVQFFRDPLMKGVLLNSPLATRMVDILAQAEYATVRAIIDTQTPQEALARIAANGK